LNGGERPLLAAPAPTTLLGDLGPTDLLAALGADADDLALAALPTTTLCHDVPFKEVDLPPETQNGRSRWIRKLIHFERPFAR
jgi:hypothetical protein